MPDLPPAATTFMCACSHHWSVHRESGQTAPGAACWGYIGSDTPGPLREPCACAGFVPWSGPRDARSGEPVLPLTLATDSRRPGPPQTVTPAERVGLLRYEHTRTEYPVPCCRKDHQNWPCSTIQALDAGAAVERERIAAQLEAYAGNYPEDVFPPGSASRDAIGGTAMRHAYRNGARMVREGAGLESATHGGDPA